MNSKVKKLWLKDLRSGEYKQGQERLKDPEGNYCCLGVLCDLHRKETNEEDWDGKGNYYFGEDKYLPPVVQEWAGFNCQNPIQLGNENDRGKTFEEIANIIEARL